MALWFSIVLFMVFLNYSNTYCFEYCSAFTILENRVEELSQEALFECFIDGLKWELQREVIPWPQSCLAKAITLEHMF